MKERYEQLKMDVVVFDADVRIAAAADGTTASATGREEPPAVSPSVTEVGN